MTHSFPTRRSSDLAAFSFDIAKAHLLQIGDRAALRFAQPLRVARGGIDLTLPVAHDYASGHTDFARRTYNLAPTGRELVSEISYAMALFGGELIANSWWRQDPGHNAAMPDARGAAPRFRSEEHTSELKSLMPCPDSVLCLEQKTSI